MINPEPQFDIARHYDVMAKLDRDIHDDEKLSASEVILALKLSRRYLGYMPKSVFLPCFGTGRHIPYLLKAGVQQIVGIDLSPACVAKARQQTNHNPRITLLEGDLLELDAKSLGYSFDATILLGNSFGDCTDRGNLLKLTAAMLAPLKSRGVFLMDYIGTEYLDRCKVGHSTDWEAMFDGKPVLDRRTPRYDAESKIMTIDVEVLDKSDRRSKVWTGAYQKAILSDNELRVHFTDQGLKLVLMGAATKLNSYVKENQNQLGMIGRSNWWIGWQDERGLASYFAHRHPLMPW